MLTSVPMDVCWLLVCQLLLLTSPPKHRRDLIMEKLLQVAVVTASSSYEIPILE
ncbi:MAG: hypothetical protein PUP91_25785 [Rhizonema sp. PD37]|nr:hypothetical protein [Rhizonema sp. PD37]